jgi:hypothetical protein
MARLLALTAILCELVGFNLTSMFSCNVSIRSESGIPLFSIDQPNLAAGLVPFHPFCVVVRSGYCLVPSRTSWVNESRRIFSHGSLQIDLSQNPESPFGDDTEESQRFPY